ncbi:hypothetical protein F8M41_017334 [Gigaspora margarita]|uniref:Uncharacterized protein n=1 Tax=Gigaspora margarita TaxID=4874 RepID=A0A8H4EM93_GIGMA|nr:hypothetical protein F8M41_017334 [Gigaspora margarita]
MQVTKLEQIPTLVTISDQNASSIKDKESIIPNSTPKPIHSSTQPQKDESRPEGSLLCNKYLLESPTEPVTSIMSLQQNIVNDDLASSLEFVEMIHKENIASTISHERKKEQGLIQEISTGNSQDDAFLSTQDHVTEILLTQNSNQVSENHVSDITILSVSRSKTLLNLATLYRKACDTEKQAIKANQDEILCWYYYVIEFDNQVKNIMKNEQVGKKKAKGQIYNFIIAQLDTKRNTLPKQTQRAKKIYRIFEKIGLDKVKYIKSYSTNTISKFTNEQIQMIIDHFTKNPTIEFIDNQNNSSDNLPKTDIGEKTLPEIERKLSKEMCNQVINKLTTHFINSPKLDKNNSIYTEGEHQTGSYWVLGSYCPLCRQNHMSLYGKWWLDSQSKNTYYLHCTNLKELGIPLDDVLKAYSGNSKQIQELKTRCFTIPIP